MSAGAGPQVKQTAPGVWAVGPWPYVAVYRYDDGGWYCQQCRVGTAIPLAENCKHIKAVINEI